MIYNLHACAEVTRLHYEFLIMFTQFLDDKDMQRIRETFQSMDDDNSGTIEVSELKSVYEHFNK